MKSVIQEASSIAKAIEQGLVKAGNPRDFSVKILEYPEKNFFGLTTKPAKIALYYDERMARKAPEAAHERSRDRHEQRPYQQQREDRPERRPSHGTEHQKPDQRRELSQQRQQQSVKQAPGLREPRPEQQQDETPLTPRWTQDMVTFAEGWLTKILSGMQRPVPFQIELNNLCLRITLQEPLFENPEKERRVLASLSLLLLETSKHTFKVNLRGHKVILTHRTIAL